MGNRGASGCSGAREYVAGGMTGLHVTAVTHCVRPHRRIRTVMSVVAKLTFFQNDLHRTHKGFHGNFETSRKTSLVVRFLEGAPQHISVVGQPISGIERLWNVKARERPTVTLRVSGLVIAQ